MKYSIIFIMLFVIIGCAKSSPDLVENDVVVNVWDSVCNNFTQIDESDLEASLSNRIIVFLNEDLTFETAEIIYFSNDCIPADIDFVLVFNGTYMLGEAIENNENEKELFLEYSKISLIPLAENRVIEFSNQYELDFIFNSQSEITENIPDIIGKTNSLSLYFVDRKLYFGEQTFTEINAEIVDPMFTVLRNGNSYTKRN